MRDLEKHLSTLLMYLSRPSVTSDLINGALQSTSFQIAKLKCNILYRVFMNYLRRLKDTVPRAPSQKKWTSPCKCGSITFVSRQCICNGFLQNNYYYYFRNLIQIRLSTWQNNIIPTPVIKHDNSAMKRLQIHNAPFIAKNQDTDHLQSIISRKMSLKYLFD